MEVLARGRIAGHEARGTVELTREAGRLQVRLSDLWVAPRAPDVRLFVSPRSDGVLDGSATDLGAVPDGEEALTVPIPAAITPDEVRSVVVYCSVYGCCSASRDWVSTDRP